jgi:hypothetical protein
MKIALFVEGHSELIFLREVILKYFNWTINLECYNLRGNTESPCDYRVTHPSSGLLIRIINIGNDERVLAYIRENGNNYISKGYTFIVGLRDMYSEAFIRRSQTKVVDSSLCNQFVSKANDLLRHEFSTIADSIELIFMIMEFETWLLSLPTVLEKFNDRLSSSAITTELGIDLTQVDHETYFFHPTNSLCKIFNIAGLYYDKSLTQINSIVSHVDNDDILSLYSQNTAFKTLIDFITI